MSDEIATILILLLVPAGIAALFSMLVVHLNRHRVHWRRWEAVGLVLPFLVWGGLMFSPLHAEKSLGNLAEVFFLVPLVPIAAQVRVFLADRVRDNISAASLIATLCVAAAAVYFLTPMLPE